MEFRDYQAAIYQQIGEHEGVNLCIQQDTGTGKSLIQIKFALETVHKGGTVAIIVPRIELIRNLEGYVKRLDPLLYRTKYSPVNDSVGNFRESAKLFIGTYQSYGKYKERIKPDVVIHDEGHHCRAKTWEALINHWDKAWHFAFTATPIRYDGKSLKYLFPKLICGESTEWYIENGYLPPIQLWVDPETVDWVSRSGGDELDSQQSVFDDYKIIGNVVKSLRKLNPTLRKTLVFATGENHANHLRDQYNEYFGREVARVVTGKLPTKVREKYIKEFDETNQYPILINIELITEGVDLKTVEVIQLCRKTESYSKYRQMCGRIRYKSDRIGLILDHAGNIRQHLDPTLQIDWEELYYADEIPTIEGFDRESLSYCCIKCDRKLLTLKELGRKQITIECPHCFYVNVIKMLTQTQLRKLQINDKIDLVEFKVEKYIQQLVRICQEKTTPHNRKIEKIVKLEKAPKKDRYQALLNLGCNEKLAELYLKNAG